MKNLPSPVKINMETVTGFLNEMGLGPVLQYIIDHSVTDRKFPRAVRLWQMAARGSLFELTGNKNDPLKLNDKPFDIIDLDERALWN